jgi:hypothetical protein
MTRMHALLIAACSLALAGCQPPARASADGGAGTGPATPAPSASTGPQRAQMPEQPEAPQAWPTSLVLAIGERVPLAGGTLELQRIAADSRCPKDAQCIWAGEVTLAFVHTPPGGAAHAFQLSQRTAPRASLGDHDIELTAFGPCPAGHAPASPAGCASVAFTASEMR